MRLALRGLTLSGSSRRRINLPPAIQDGSGVAVLVTAVLAAGLVLSSASVSAAASTAAAGQVRGGASVAAAGMIAADGRPPTQAGVAAVPVVSAAGLVAGEAETAAVPDVIAGGEGTLSYESSVLALAPAGYWRLNHAVGQAAAATVGSAGSYQGTPEIVLLRLVANTAVGSCSGFDDGHYLTLDTPIASANFTFDCVLQVDGHKTKHVIATTGGGSVSGQFSIELVDDGASGLQVRCWSVQPGGGLFVQRSPAGSVPIGDAFKLSYRRNADGTQSALINGIEQTLTTESGSAPVSWDPPPAGTVYVGRWSSGVDPLDGVMAELAIWNTPVSNADLLSLALAQSMVWLPEAFDAGSVDASAAKQIDIGALAHPAAGITVSRVTPNPARGSTSISGTTITYTAGSTTGDDDTFGVRISKGGLTSGTCTLTIDVTTGTAQSGENENLPYFGRFYGGFPMGHQVGNVNWTRSNTHGVANFFFAPKSGKIVGFRTHVRIQATAYSNGDGGTYTVELREANIDTRFPITSGPPICQLTGWRPAGPNSENPNVNPASSTPVNLHIHKTFTTQGNVVAKKGYCLIFRNTHGSPGSNYVAQNNQPVYQYNNASADPNDTSHPPEFWNPARIVINGVERAYFPWPITTYSDSYRWRRIGTALMEVQYEDGTWSGPGGVYGSDFQDDARAITTTAHWRERFRVTRASRVVDGFYTHLWRLNNGSGNVIVTLEQGPASDTSGNGTVLEEVTIQGASIYDAGSSFNAQEILGAADKIPWIWVPFAQQRTLQLGQIYNIRFRASAGTHYARLCGRAEQQGMSPVASSWEEHEQIREINPVCWEDSRGVQVSSNSGSSWSFYKGRWQGPALFRCVV